MLIVGASLVFGFAGNVEKGPSWIERLLGGLPLSFPVIVLLLAGQALDTAGPCLFRARDGDFPVADAGFADLGSSNEALAE